MDLGAIPYFAHDLNHLERFSGCRMREGKREGTLHRLRRNWNEDFQETRLRAGDDAHVGPDARRGGRAARLGNGFGFSRW